MATPQELPTLAGPADVEPTLQERRIAGRSLGQLAWARLRRDHVAMAGFVVVVLIVLLAILAPAICAVLGIDPTTFHTNLISADTSLPNGPFSGASKDHWLGVEPGNGRDILARVLYGARVSLIVSVLATVVQVLIGVVVGLVAGFFGGWVDTVLARIMDVFLAFPVLLFSIALLVVFQGVDTFLGMSGVVLRLFLLIFIIGFFSWPYVARIIRGQVLSLREKEFVDAARSLGAGSGRILAKELIPNLIAPILVYSSLTIPVNIIYEATLSFLGVGIQEPTSSWGKMLSDALGTFTIDPWYMFVPGLAIVITVLSFNLFGDGVRDAFDPKSSR
jgi:ABC-type dipeptide/oligopeptide/nickel transport system permease subunit